MFELPMIYQWLVLAGLVFSLGMALANLATFKGLRAAPPFGPGAPRVSILVPARNEARNIQACVSSLLAQDYPNFELIVLDDHSEDETGLLLRELGLLEGGEGGRQVLNGTALPPGWTGKSWACHQLAGRARGEYLFFTDADTVHSPGTVGALVACSQRTGATLVSAWPRLLTETLGEKLIIPMILLVGMTLYPHWLLTRLQKRGPGSGLSRETCRSLGAANGQSLFFTRTGYDQIGGHVSVREHLVEDVALGREVAARLDEGMVLYNCEAVEFSTCRMYRSFGEVWEGFTKNARPAFERSVGAFLFFGALQACLFLGPFIWIWMSGTPRGLIFGQLALIYLIRVLLAARFRTSLLGALLHPFGHVLVLGIGLNSWRRSAGGGVRWKGRIYQHVPGN
jgi:chlorobactene glucosyltransferase